MTPADMERGGSQQEEIRHILKCMIGACLCSMLLFLILVSSSSSTSATSSSSSSGVLDMRHEQLAGEVKNGQKSMSTESATAIAKVSGYRLISVRKGAIRRLIGSTRPICTYNECRGCRTRCRAEQVPVDANDPLNSAYHYRCVCHK